MNSEEKIKIVFQFILILILFAGDISWSQSRAVLKNTLSSIGRVSEWEMNFSYKLDVSYVNNFEGASEDVYRFIESDGVVTFTKSRQRGKFAGEGKASYDLESISITTLDKFFKTTNKPNKPYKILNTTKGNGTTKIINEIEMNYLEFDYEDYSYSFRLIPGEEFDSDFGVPSQSVLDMEIVDPLTDETKERHRDKSLKEKLKAIMPEKIVYDQFVSTFSIEAFNFPVPFFGETLAGSTTDAAGGVLTWIIKPKNVEVTKNETSILESETWVHFHPSEYDYQNNVKSAWKETVKGLKRKNAGVYTEAKSVNIYLIKEKAAGEKIKLSTGDALVPVDISNLNQINIPKEIEEKVKASQEALAVDWNAENEDETDERISTAILTLFNCNCETKYNNLVNIVQKYPLILEDIELNSREVTIKMWGANIKDKKDLLRIKGQFEHTVRANSSNEVKLKIFLNNRAL